MSRKPLHLRNVVPYLAVTVMVVLSPLVAFGDPPAQQGRDKMEELRSTHASEAMDSPFAVEWEQAIGDALGQHADRFTTPPTVSCKTTMCRIHIQFDSERSVAKVMDELMTTQPLDGRTRFKERFVDGHAEVELFVSRYAHFVTDMQ